MTLSNHKTFPNILSAPIAVIGFEQSSALSANVSFTPFFGGIRPPRPPAAGEARALAKRRAGTFSKPARVLARFSTARASEGARAFHSTSTKGGALARRSRVSTMPCGDLALREGSDRPPGTSIRGNPSSKQDVTAGETAQSLSQGRGSKRGLTRTERQCVAGRRDVHRASFKSRRSYIGYCIEGNRRWATSARDETVRAPSCGSNADAERREVEAQQLGVTAGETA